MRRLANDQSSGLLTFGVAGALWSSPAALNRAYDIDEGWPWWKVRITPVPSVEAMEPTLGWG